MSTGILEGMASSCRDVHQTRGEALRQAWRLAALQWHPDKFMAQHGQRIRQDQQAAIERRLQVIWQQLQHERQTLLL